MTREERCQLAIERGYKYDPESGLIYNRYGKIVNSKYKNGYIQLGIQIQLPYKTFKLSGHQFAWYWVYKECVSVLDHINGIKNDNRICNLRSVTNQQNQFNRPNVKGYYWHKIANKWHTQIKLNRKIIHLGYFNTEEQARQAYLDAKQKFHVI